MTAKEMFEKLGYKLIPNVDIKRIIHNKDTRFNKNIIKAYEYCDERFNIFIHILFFDNNMVFKWNYSHQCGMFITFEELKAINKQIEELGWDNE